MVKSIYLQDGEEIFVDDEDYERVSQHTWYKNFNVNSRNIINMESILLATFILKGSFQVVKNNDFTRSNLTTKGSKNRYMRAKTNNISKYKGVTWLKRDKKWRVIIKVEGKNKYLGCFDNEDDAARVYNQAVLDYWDGDGFINVIGEDNRVPIREYKKNQNIRRGITGYRCVSKDKRRKNTFISEIFFNKCRHYLGVFRSKHQAALAYNKCAIYLHGDDAILNDVPITDELKEFIDNWEIPEKIKQLKDNK